MQVAYHFLVTVIFPELIGLLVLYFVKIFLRFAEQELKQNLSPDLRQP